MWPIYALLCAFSLATSDALSKKAMSHRGEYVVAWAKVGYAAPLLLLSLFFVDIPHLSLSFWLTVLMLVPMEIIAYLLYMRAIRVSPLSLTLPFLALTPVFLIFTSFLLLGELPDRSGLLGIGLVALGAYILNLHATFRGGILASFKAVRNEPGAVYMIIVAFIYSITSNLGKIAILQSSPVFFGILYFVILAVVLFPITLKLSGCGVNNFLRASIPLAPIGLCYYFMILFHVIALSQAPVAYMISVKRTSLVFGVLYGGLCFKEKHIRERLWGVTIMVAGVVMILLL